MKEPYLVHSDLTGAIYTVVGKDKYNVTEQAKKAVKAVSKERWMPKDTTEIMNVIHDYGVENEVFELLTQWMIEDRYNKMKNLRENEALLRAINKIATQNTNMKQAIDGIISLSEREE